MIKDTVTKEDVIKLIEDIKERSFSFSSNRQIAIYKIEVLIELLTGKRVYFDNIKDIYDHLSVKYEIENDMIYRLDESGKRI